MTIEESVWRKITEGVGLLGDHKKLYVLSVSDAMSPSNQG
jgi:hypothetical protein